MINGYDIAYGLALGLASPYWLLRPSARRKVLRPRPPAQRNPGPAVLIHAVSLGEINATPALVDLLRSRRPGLQFIVSTTTNTGHQRGADLYGKSPDVTLIRWPLDFSLPVGRVLDRLAPSAVALMELEVWPNFMLQCSRRQIPVLLINGRMTSGSFSKYRLARPLVRPMFARLTRVCAQDDANAQRFIALGATPSQVAVTGTMKFDTAAIASEIPGSAELAAELGLTPKTAPLWVCGSTGPGEEALILPQFRRLLEKYPALRLAIIPRKPERFDEVAALIRQSGFDLLRRTSRQTAPPGSSPVILGDTMGELRKFYSLADVVFVGRTLLDLGSRQHGSDMIEPAALAKPVIVGPFTGNFAEPMDRFLQADAIIVVPTPASLADQVSHLLSTPPSARAMALRAQQVVRDQQGATPRNAQALLDVLPPAQM